MPPWLTAGLPHIWLPYAQMKHAPTPLPVLSASGCRLTLADRRELIDGIASWWSVCHGYQHPHIVAAMQEQLANLSHVMLGGLAHAPAYRLAARLSALAPGNLPRVFFSDSGSVAVEVALKMALQYWRNTGQPNKNKFICFRHGYHGDTIGAMSVSDPEDSLHKAFRSTIPMQYVLDIPSDEYALAEFQETLAAIAGSVAGLIIEPLVQGAGGMRFYSADILAAIRAACMANNILFIADEIATGFGRTGYLFACEEAGITPDILCLGKALTGGMVGLAATLTSATVFDAFYDDDRSKAFMHGPTFMGNPLACAAANASLDLFEREPRLAQVEAIETILRRELSPCYAYPTVRDVRVKGAIGVVELHSEYMDFVGLRRRFSELGVWIRPFGNIIYLTPPLVIAEDELLQLTGAMHTALGELEVE